MVSEDSDHLGSGFLAIRRLDDLQEVRQTRPGQVIATGHPLNAVRELLKVSSLRGAQRVLPEERNDHVQQIDPPSDNVPVHILAVIVDTPVAEHSSDTKELSEVHQTLETLLALCDREFVLHLVAGSVADSGAAICLPRHAE
jgi:hypothetical protein